MFATLCMLEIKPSHRALCLRRAGHPPPMLIEGDSVHSLPLDDGGLPIGMFEGTQWPESRFALPSEWSILLYTDGVVEGGDGGPCRLGDDGPGG
jgi:serine phosphatase RsbU (regulator of sigma subunit)